MDDRCVETMYIPGYCPLERVVEALKRLDVGAAAREKGHRRTNVHVNRATIETYRLAELKVNGMQIEEDATIAYQSSISFDGMDMNLDYSFKSLRPKSKIPGHGDTPMTIIRNRWVYGFTPAEANIIVSALGGGIAEVRDGDGDLHVVPSQRLQDIDDTVLQHIKRLYVPGTRIARVDDGVHGAVESVNGLALSVIWDNGCSSIVELDGDLRFCLTVDDKAPYVEQTIIDLKKAILPSGKWELDFEHTEGCPNDMRVSIFDKEAVRSIHETLYDKLWFSMADAVYRYAAKAIIENIKIKEETLGKFFQKAKQRNRRAPCFALAGTTRR